MVTDMRAAAEANWYLKVWYHQVRCIINTDDTLSVDKEQREYSYQRLIHRWHPEPDTQVQMHLMHV